ncbi:MAG: hypothetical protein H7246_02260 [Phycisphaerae bacterium]|nr:hypothetical protein [Saprospiraceae bacterium]
MKKALVAREQPFDAVAFSKAMVSDALLLLSVYGGLGKFQSKNLDQIPPLKV